MELGLCTFEEKLLKIYKNIFNIHIYKYTKI